MCRNWAYARITLACCTSTRAMLNRLFLPFMKGSIWSEVVLGWTYTFYDLWNLHPSSLNHSTEAIARKAARVERTSSASATRESNSVCEEPLYTSPFDDLSVQAGDKEFSTESEKGDSNVKERVIRVETSQTSTKPLSQCRTWAAGQSASRWDPLRLNALSWVPFKRKIGK